MTEHSSHMSVLEGSDDYRVPKDAVPVELVIEGGLHLIGNLYVSPAAPNHEGRERVLEMLTRERRFIPIVTAQGSRLVNTDRIAVVRLGDPFDAGLDGADGTESVVPEVHVRVQLTPDLPNEGMICGRMRVSQPNSRPRVLDLLNESDKFCAVFDGGEAVLIAKHYIAHLYAE